MNIVVETNHARQQAALPWDRRQFFPAGIRRCAKRYEIWLSKTLGKEAAGGFAEPLAAAISPHLERVE